MPFQIHHADAASILTPVSGFLLEAGFTHSLTPARNCTFGCSYCYVPTLRVQAGLRPEDWSRWGHHTTFKSNAARLLGSSLRAGQIVYCSPLTDPYQPAEAAERLMPGILEALVRAPHPPEAFVIQTRGPLIVDDIHLLLQVSRRTRLAVGFSVTTDREDVRRIFEPHCAPLEERWQAMAALRAAGIGVFATLAPVLPCDPEALIRRALDSTTGPVIADPFHVREVKRSGATTRPAAIETCRRYGWMEWLDPVFQRCLLARMRDIAAARGREFGYGPDGFRFLAENREHTAAPGSLLS
ncbi:MAG: radical SAM protein [Acidobacteriota bacterium]